MFPDHRLVLDSFDFTPCGAADEDGRNTEPFIGPLGPLLLLGWLGRDLPQERTEGRGFPHVLGLGGHVHPSFSQGIRQASQLVFVSASLLRMIHAVKPSGLTLVTLTSSTLVPG